MATTPTTGTSLEVLAPYLCYGPPIQWQGWNGKDEFLPCRDKLAGLNQQHVRLVSHPWALSYAECLPVLRPFWQLCDPLADGTIPAVEALRLALGWPESFYRSRFTARLSNNIPGEWCVRIESYSDLSGGWIRLGGDFGTWLFEAFDSYEDGVGKEVKVVNPLAAYDYLRSQHFAVGLEPHQFLEATPATPPIEKEAGQPTG